MAFRPAEKVIERYVKIICNSDESFVVCFSSFVFVAAYGVLVEVKLYGKAHLRYSTAFPKFFQTKHSHHPLTKVYHSGIIIISRFGIFYAIRRNLLSRKVKNMKLFRKIAAVASAAALAVLLLLQ